MQGFTVKQAVEKLQEMMDSHNWGEITFHFQNGKIVYITTKITEVAEA